MGGLKGKAPVRTQPGIQHAERKAIYERLHPEAKHGGDRGNQHTGGKSRQTDNLSTCQSYAADAAAATGNLQSSTIVELD